MGQFESCGHPEVRAVTSSQETEMLFPGEGGDTGQKSPHLTMLDLEEVAELSLSVCQLPVLPPDAGSPRA